MNQRNWLDNDREKLKKDYLKIPSHYSEMVDRCVQRELHKGEARSCHIQRTYKKRRFGWTKAIICAGLLVAAIGGSVLAASISRLADYMGDSVSEKNKENIIIMDTSQQEYSDDLPELLKFAQTSESQQFPEALMEIKEIYFDGALLYIYGNSTEAGKNYELNSDRIVVNGTQYIGGVYSTKGIERNDVPNISEYEYFGCIQLVQEHFTEDFQVEIPFGVSKRFTGNVVGVGDEMREYRDDGQYTDENNERYNIVNVEDVQNLGFQTISFTVPASSNEIVSVSDQSIEIEDGSVNLESLTLTPSTAYIKFTWKLSGDGSEEKIKALAASGVEFVDNNGNVYDSFENSGISPNGTPLTCEYSQDGEGNWTVEKEYYIEGIPMDINTLEVHPYQFTSMTPINNAGYLEYGNFTISIE